MAIMCQQWYGKAKRFLWEYRGNAGVEFALVLPLLMLLLFGGIEIGRALHDFHVVNETVRDAARYLSRVAVTCPSAGVGAGSLVNAVDGDRAKALAITGSVETATPAPGLLSGWDYPADAGSVTYRIDCIDNSAGDFKGIYDLGGKFCDPANPDDPTKCFVPHVVLTANAPFTFLFGGLVALDPTITITLSHNVVAIGQ